MKEPPNPALVLTVASRPQHTATLCGPDIGVTGINENVVEGVTRYSLMWSRAGDASERIRWRRHKDRGLRRREVGARKARASSSFHAGGGWM